MAKALATRQKILMAALQLLTGEDIAHKLSIDAVSEKCGISSATIRYHFGGKAGFVDAIWQHLLQIRSGHTLAMYYTKHKNLLASPEGQKEFIRGMFEDFLYFFQGSNGLEQQRWIRLFFIETINFPKRRRAAVKNYIEVELETFHTICGELCGDRLDRDQTDTWFLFIMHPLAVSFSHMAPQQKSDSSDFQKRILAFAERVFLLELNRMRVKYGKSELDLM